MTEQTWQTVNAQEAFIIWLAGGAVQWMFCEPSQSDEFKPLLPVNTLAIFKRDEVKFIALIDTATKEL